MVESAALLVDGILPDAPIRQWVLSLPYDLRFLLANNPEMITDVLKVIHRAIGSYLIKKAGLTIKTGKKIGRDNRLNLIGHDFDCIKANDKDELHNLTLLSYL